MLNELIELVLADAALIFGSFIALWGISMWRRDSSLVDIWFAPCIAAGAVMGVFLADGVQARRILIALLTVLWAVRLGGYLAWRNWGHEDPRYARFRQHIEDQGKNFAWQSLKSINLYQGAIVFLAMAPIIVAQVSNTPAQLGILAYLGSVLVIGGVSIEGVADLQLSRFKANLSNNGKVLDTGLWRYSRHPNYFGESCIWWGYWLVACEHPWGMLTIFSPAFMTWSILGMMGKELVERRMLKKHAGYKEYITRTSSFIPWPPKKS